LVKIVLADFTTFDRIGTQDRLTVIVAGGSTNLRLLRMK
jgi:hypothetical protein